MAATTAAYNFWLYELCDVYIVGLSDLTLNDTLLMEISGSYETHDGSICVCEDPLIFTADALSLLGLRPASSSPFHAFRHRGTVAKIGAKA